jgi:DNA-binding beta-propeller fold protein YncE
MRRPLIALAATACVQDVGPPDLGSCAVPAERGSSYGEIGIGSCLSGPSDLQFFEQDGRAYLAVVNANPFLDFETGNLIVVDWASVDASVDRNAIGDLDVASLPIAGLPNGLALIERTDGRVALVSDRFSEGSLTTNADDRVHLIDLSDPTAPVVGEPGELSVHEDPGPVAQDDAGLVFVANVSDRSVSVIDAAADPIAVLDVAGGGVVTPARFYDDDESGSAATATTFVTGVSLLPDETWTFEWVSGATRLFAPEDGGLVRHVVGSDGVATTPGFDLDPGDPDATFAEVSDPVLVEDDVVPQLFFADSGAILGASLNAGGFGAPEVVIGPGADDGWDAVRGGPGPVVYQGVPLLFFDGRAEVGATASIGLAARDVNGVWVVADTPAIEDPAFASLEDPWARFDAQARRLRVWMSAWDGDRWTIALSESDDGLTFSPPETVLSVPGGHVAAPVVQVVDGRYRLWAAVHDGGGWTWSRSTSNDGRTWSDPEPVLDTSHVDPFDPPRAAVQAPPTGGFRVSGRSVDPSTSLATAGATYAVADAGFSVRVATGHHADPSPLGDDVVGLRPTSSAAFAGARRWFADALHADGTVRASWWTWDGDVARVVSTDLLPDAGFSAAVRATDTSLDVVHAVPLADGTNTLARATSTDGFTFTPSEAVFPPAEVWNRIGRRPHHLESLDSGGVRLWYSAFDGSRWRIGTQIAEDGVTFEDEPGDDGPWQLGPGAPGTLDDSGVRDPSVWVDGDTLHLWYAGTPDGITWQILHAARPAAGGPWVRDNTSVPAMFGVSSTFSDDGVAAPVVWADGDGVAGLYAGFDGLTDRVGALFGTPHTLYPRQRVPTDGDRLVLASRRGGDAADSVRLNQSVDGTVVTGVGVSTLSYDAARGFVYVSQRRGDSASAYLTALDVRDDSDGTWVDANVFDVEAVLRLDPNLIAAGARDVVAVGDRLYVTAQNPESLVVLRTDGLVDDARKDVVADAHVATFPLLRIGTADPSRPFADEDAGPTTDAAIAGAGLTLLPDGHTLLVAHFRDNAVLAYDTALGAYGQEIRRIPFVGENPHTFAVSPDGRFAVVANYVGEIDDDESVHSTLAVIDVDPASPTYLEVVTWLVNR